MNDKNPFGRGILPGSRRNRRERKPTEPHSVTLYLNETRCMIMARVIGANPALSEREVIMYALDVAFLKWLEDHGDLGRSIGPGIKT